MPDMSTTQDDGHEGPAPARTSAPEGVLQDSKGVKSLYIAGIPDDAGVAVDVSVSDRETMTDKGLVQWKRIEIRSLRLHSNAHLHLAQGLSLANLLISGRIDDVAESPLIYLRGRLSDLWVVPCVVRDLVLAQPKTGPEGLTIKEMVSALFQQEMASVK